MILTIPSELNRPGLIDLTDWRIGAYEYDWFPCGCGGGFTPGFRGTLEILSIDASGLSFKLYGSHFDRLDVGDGFGSSGFDADGLYAASICP